MAASFIIADFQLIFLNNLKFSRQVDITSIKVEFGDEFDPVNRLQMSVVFNNSLSL